MQSGVNDSRLSLPKGENVMIKNEKVLIENTSPLFKELSTIDIQKAENYIQCEVMKNVYTIYGKILPDIVSNRLETELAYITKSDLAPIYLIAYIISKYLSDNELIASRGYIRSSLVAFLLGLTNVNPLPPHYYCPNCKYTKISLIDTFYSGYDLPEKECPICKNKLLTDGHNIPYESFIKPNDDKLSVIKLNIPFSFKDELLKYINNLLEDKFVLTANKSSIIIERSIDHKNKNLNVAVCKIDLLGFVPLEILSLLKKYTGIDSKDIDINDPKIYKLFVDSRTIGINSDEPATLEVPEFGTKYVRDIIKVIKPSNFGELVKISNLAHGTKFWFENAEYLLTNEICTLKELPTSFEDVYEYLTSCEIDKAMAIKIADAVSQGVFEKSGLSKDDKIIKALNSNNIPHWYFDSICKVREMFSKAHSVEYVKMALIFAWYKIYYPVEFYVAVFNVRYPDTKFEFIENEKNNLQIATDCKTTKEFDEDALALYIECIERGIIFERNQNHTHGSEPYSVCDNKILVNY